MSKVAKMSKMSGLVLNECWLRIERIKELSGRREEVAAVLSFAVRQEPHPPVGSTVFSVAHRRRCWLDERETEDVEDGKDVTHLKMSKIRVVQGADWEHRYRG